MKLHPHHSVGVLALIAGILGAHKFALGKRREGLLMLLTSTLGGMLTLGVTTGLVYIIAMLEGFIYIVTPPLKFEERYIKGGRRWF